MAGARGNPVEQKAGRKAFSQQVANPVGSGMNTDKGNEKLRVSQNKSKKLSQSVGNPSDGARRK